MEVQQIFTTILIGSIGGLMGGVFGIGGAIVIIPALIMTFGYSQHLAQGTTLLMLAFPVSALSAWQYYKDGNANIKVALILGVAFFISGFFGAKIAHLIPQEILKKMFAVLLIVIAGKMMFFDK